MKLCRLAPESRLMPSASLEREPTDTYMVAPSGENTMSRVAWPPTGSWDTTVSGSPREERSPLR